MCKRVRAGHFGHTSCLETLLSAAVQTGCTFSRFGVQHTTNVFQFLAVHERSARDKPTSVVDVNLVLFVEVEWPGGAAATVSEALGHYLQSSPLGGYKCRLTTRS